MFDVGPEKILLVAVIALVFLGPEKLPGLFRQIGRGLAEIRNASSAVQAEMTGAMIDDKDEPTVRKAPAATEAGNEGPLDLER